MLPLRRSLTLVIASTVCLLVGAGCGGKNTVAVTGTLVFPTNVKLNDNDHVQITFVPEADTGLAAPATFSPSEKTFVANNPMKKGVLPGKYKITVKLEPYPGYPDSEKRSASFAKINRKYDADHSKLAYDVTEEPTQSITIDLAHGKVSKN